MNALRLLAVFACSVSLCACSNLAVGPSSPRPNILLTADKTPARLVMGPAIKNDLTIADTASVNEVPVRGWRVTLEYGFRNAFPRAESGRTLELIEAELSFGPAAVGPGGTAAVVAHVRFKARVTDAAGAEVAALAGTATAREANTSASEEGMTRNAQLAVEALYEKLAAELLIR
jgi:hypothetical protein